MEKETRNKLLALLIIISIILVGFYFKKKKQSVLSQQYEVVQGKIVKSKPIGGVVSYYEITYEYKVDGEILKGRVSVNSKFKCANNPKDFCLGNTFIVKYSKKDPSISDIDLKTYNSLKL